MLACAMHVQISPVDDTSSFVVAERQLGGMYWRNITIKHTKVHGDYRILPDQQHTGVLEFAQDKYAAFNLASNVWTIPQLAAGLQSTQFPIVVQSEHLSWARCTVSKAAASTLANNSQDLATSITSGASEGVSSKLPSLPVTISNAGSAKQWVGLPKSPTVVDLAGLEAAVQLVVGSSLVLRNLVVVNGGRQRAAAGAADGARTSSSRSALADVSSMLWAITGLRSDLDLQLVNVTLVVPPAELALMAGALSGAPAAPKPAVPCSGVSGCVLNEEVVQALTAWATASRASVTSPQGTSTPAQIYVTLWRGWRWHGTNITVTSALPTAVAVEAAAVNISLLNDWSDTGGVPLASVYGE